MARSRFTLRSLAPETVCFLWIILEIWWHVWGWHFLFFLNLVLSLPEDIFSVVFREEERERRTDIDQLWIHTHPNQGSNLLSGPLPWRGIEFLMFWSTGQQSNQLNDSSRGREMAFLKSPVSYKFLSFKELMTPHWGNYLCSMPTHIHKGFQLRARYA